jgi:glycosyltransferase involved in cell wall biosynthesis
MYVFPSLCEGFGLPGLEAMQNNLPVISSDASSLPEIYGNAALYFNSRNSEELVKAVLELGQNKKLRKEMIKKGRQRIKKFSWQKCAQKTLDIYESIF